MVCRERCGGLVSGANETPVSLLTGRRKRRAGRAASSTSGKEWQGTSTSRALGGLRKGEGVGLGRPTTTAPRVQRAAASESRRLSRGKYRNAVRSEASRGMASNRRANSPELPGGAAARERPRAFGCLDRLFAIPVDDYYCGRITRIHANRLAKPRGLTTTIGSNYSTHRTDRHTDSSLEGEGRHTALNRYTSEIPCPFSKIVERITLGHHSVSRYWFSIGGSRYNCIASMTVCTKASVNRPCRRTIASCFGDAIDHGEA